MSFAKGDFERETEMVTQRYPERSFHTFKGNMSRFKHYKGRINIIDRIVFIGRAYFPF